MVFLFERTIKRDFIVAASKCNEMLSLVFMHEFVLLFFRHILYRIFSFYLNHLQKFQKHNTGTEMAYLEDLTSDRIINSSLCPLSTYTRK